MPDGSATTNESALRQYIETLDSAEKSQFNFITVEDVLTDARLLEKKQAVFSRIRRVLGRVEPIVKFVQRYAQAIDSMVQYNPHPSALAWGCFRFLIEIAGSFTSYFAKLLSMMEKIGDKLPFYERYEEMFADSESFRGALANVYYDIILFLCRARKVFKTGGLMTLGRTLWKPFETEFEAILENLSRHTELLKAETTLAHRQTIHIDRKRRVMEWLSPVDVQTDHDRERRRKATGTGQWITKDSIYKDWRDFVDPGSVLWVRGGPGTGKSVLCTSIIEDLEQLRVNGANILIGYFFFDKNNDKKTTLLSLLTSLIAQSISRMPTIPKILFDAYAAAIKYGQAHMLMSDSPIEVLRSILKTLPRFHIILDGLDECKEVQPALEAIIDLTTLSKCVRLICLSRDTTDVRRLLDNHKTIKLSAECTKTDIDLYLQEEIANLSSTLDDDSLHDLLFDRLSQGADGVFLWAYLMLQTVKQAPSPFELAAMLDQLPHGLSEVYESILDDLGKEPPANQRLAKKIFLWVCCANRPLSWAELQCALAMEPQDDELNPAKKPFKGVVLRLCNPLIEYLPDLDTFRPIHLSVSEFLLEPPSSLALQKSDSEWSFRTSKADADCYITQTCLAYLSSQSVAGSISFEPIQAPLVEYATSNWCQHLSQSPPCHVMETKLNSFLSVAPWRRVWQTRWLLIQFAACPLQNLLKQQRSVQDWINNCEGQAQKFVFDILEDMFEVILELDKTSPFLPDSTFKGSGMGIGHFEKMMVIRDLARAYTISGRLSDAEHWLEVALKAQQAQYGQDAKETVWLLNSLGLIYDQQLRFEFSAETQRKALSIQQACLPHDHLEIVWTINELGRVYRHLYRLKDAEDMHLQALRILKSAFSEDDAQIVWTVNTLARTYRLLGRVDEAVKMHERALASQQRIMGAEHPHALWTMTDLARCYRDQGDISKAYEQQLTALEARYKVLGPLHSDTLWSMNDVGLLLSALGRTKEAKECHENALAGQRTMLGEDHAHTIWSRNMLDSWVD